MSMVPQATAQLGGTVKDESNAVLPGVTVTVTQTDTSFTRSSVTDGSGNCVLSNLPTGPYKLKVSLQGLRRAAPLHAATLGQPPATQWELHPITLRGQRRSDDVRSSGQWLP